VTFKDGKYQWQEAEPVKMGKPAKGLTSHKEWWTSWVTIIGMRDLAAGTEALERAFLSTVVGRDDDSMPFHWRCWQAE
jgi:hypothetical protein